MPCIVHLSQIPTGSVLEQPLMVFESFEVVQRILTSGFDGQVTLTDNASRVRLSPIRARDIIAVQPII